MAAGGAQVRAKHLVIPVMLALTGCGARAAEAPISQMSSVADLASLLEGEFTTAPSAANPDAAVPRPEHVFYETAKRVDVPSLGPAVVYAELREGASDGHVLWQRLFALNLDGETGRITMTPYGFANGGQMEHAATDSKPLATLRPADLKPQSGGCVVTWHRIEDGFEGTGQPGACPGAKPDNAKDPAPVLSVTKTSLTDRLDSGPADTDLVFRRLR
jgi:hypothetical protein